MGSARQVVRIGLLVVGVLGTIGCAHQQVPWVQPPLAPEVQINSGRSGSYGQRAIRAFRT